MQIRRLGAACNKVNLSLRGDRNTIIEIERIARSQPSDCQLHSDPDPRQSKDVSAAVLESKIRVKYAFNKNVGLVAGVNYFNGDIEIKKTDTKSDINYGFDGLFIGLDFGF